MGSGPLQDVRVIDLANFLAGPFCATIFAEFGADVIKVEQPGVGDPCRYFGTMTDVGDTMVWLSEARNKRSVTLDLRKPEGAEICKKLVAQADVVVENFRPGVLEGWGLGYEDLKAVNPQIVMVRISGYGQTGPYKQRPGFARIAHAFSGLVYLAGEAGRQPVMPGSTSLADYMSGVCGRPRRDDRPACPQDDRQGPVRRPRALRIDLPAARRDRAGLRQARASYVSAWVPTR